MGAQIAAYQIPGAVVAVVRGEETLLAKGYGLADVERGIPVRGDRTLFRVGSVAKVLTWMALLQLAEDRALVLDADVNHHLGELALPATFPEPVTPAHLMTHSAGLEDRFAGLFAADGRSLLSLRDYLGRYRPARVRPPGRVTAYSNYGAALAGHLVERVSGRGFADFIAERTLGPLGMTRSSFAQPLAGPLHAALATGYGERQEALPFEWLQAGPAGALSTTATDMAALMRALLQGGRIGGLRVLGEASVEAMLTRQFANDPRVAGLTFGLEEFYVNGRRLLWHPGDTLGFSAALVLLPAEGIGLFVAYNRLADSQPRADLLKVFMDRFFPAPAVSAPSPGHGAAERARQYAGSYLTTRSHLTGPEKVFKLFRPVTVHPLPDGRLRMRGLWVVKDGLWAEVGPGEYRHVGSEEVAVFREEAGRMMLVEGNYPQGAYLKLPWYGANGLHVGVWVLCALVFLVALGAAALRALCRRGLAPAPAGTWTARLVGAMSLVHLATLLGVLLVLANLRALVAEVDAALQAVSALARAGALLTGAGALAVVGLWWRGSGTLVARVGLSGVAAAGVLFALSLAYWRVPG
jgi:CubicO group peptidase (beta-lactamase class C family)